ncbi:AAA family ATPase [Maioricimonas sp. JC845]|uniref:AAA family ATPase n=1 Tax=Maioricimonas sp. JC845 TaxID=3232138 RepID=UPI00345A1A99
MIQSIHIADVATYGSPPCTIDGLSTFNYFYGPNGSGKTTLSRVLNTPGEYERCSIRWQNDSPVDVLVYNEQFVEAYFRQSDELPGVFTLGKSGVEALEKIEAARKDVQSLSEKLNGLKSRLKEKHTERDSVEKRLRDSCWDLKERLGPELKLAFDGYHGSKEKLRKEVLAQRGNSTCELRTLDELKTRAATVYADDVTSLEPIETPDFQRLTSLEQSPLLQKKLIGTADVDVAAIITHLKNSDWVRTGIPFLEHSQGRCPFCQQPVSDDLADRLNSYFDESYERDTKAIATLAADYTKAANAISEQLDSLLVNAPPQLNSESLRDKVKRLKSHVEVNQQRLQEKQKEPSRSITLEPVDTIEAEIEQLLGHANQLIAEHNRTVANLAQERENLKREVWRHFIDEALSVSLDTYDRESSKLSSAIDNIEKKIETQEEARRQRNSEIAEWEKDLTSTQPTIDAINGLLKHFGFRGFSLAPANERGYYKLIRDDGSDAKKTLSEGERTFITFLYFYHLLEGSHDETGVDRDRVAVIDDPVSSLDSEILFVVSTLIHKLRENIRNNASTVKQLFLLTHNVYFHKEITHDRKRGNNEKLKDETFWIVRKVDGKSRVDGHDSNPVRSSYELLWREVREGECDDLTVQNSMRRILENYFKIFGGINLPNLVDRFDGEEKVIVRSLLSWVHDGSHFVHDDLYITIDDATLEQQRNVFRRIFEIHGHKEHYNMMMRIAETSSA